MMVLMSYDVPFGNHSSEGVLDFEVDTPVGHDGDDLENLHSVGCFA